MFARNDEHFDNSKTMVNTRNVDNVRKSSRLVKSDRNSRLGLFSLDNGKRRKLDKSPWKSKVCRSHQRRLSRMEKLRRRQRSRELAFYKNKCHSANIRCVQHN